MPSDDVFDPEQYVYPEAQAALISDALASGDAVFVWVALRTALRAQDLSVDVVLPDDPKLSIVLGALDRLGIDLLAVVRKA